jgi:dTDP-glucose 4,6-dehydratase
MRLLVTGGTGFIGSHFIRYWLDNYPDDKVVNFDAPTYVWKAGNLDDVRERFFDRYAFFNGDITDMRAVTSAFDEHKPHVVVNFAAESHNSRAILDPEKFFRTNVLGTQTLLEACRRKGIERFQHISTCEVYGDLPLDSCGYLTEGSPLRPRTPYNASKAGADLAVQAYHHTFNLPTVISRSSNNYGPSQFPEKVIPLFITSALERRPLSLYEHSQNRREWLHVHDHCRAIDLMIKKGRSGEIYNVGSGVEKSVEEIADAVLAALCLPGTMKKYVPDRPSHARRYLLDSTKARKALGWRPTIEFEQGLQATVKWYAEHPAWWQALKARATVQETNWAGQTVATSK